MEGWSEARIQDVSRALLISVVIDCAHLSQWPLQLLSKKVITRIIPFLRVFLLFAVLVEPLITFTPYSLLLLLSIMHLLLLLMRVGVVTISLTPYVETWWLRISPLRVPLLLHLLLSLSFSLSSHSFFLNFTQFLNLSFLFPVVLLSLRCLVALRLLGLKVSAIRIGRGHHILMLLVIHILIATLLLWLLLLLLAVPVLNLSLLLLSHHTTCLLFLTVHRKGVRVLHRWLWRCRRLHLRWLARHLCFDLSYGFYYGFSDWGDLYHIISHIPCLVHLGVRFIDSLLQGHLPIH